MIILKLPDGVSITVTGAQAASCYSARRWLATVSVMSAVMRLPLTCILYFLRILYSDFTPDDQSNWEIYLIAY